MVLASDGLWEKFSNEEVVQMVGKYIESNGRKDNVCSLLIRQVLGNDQSRISYILGLSPDLRRAFYDDTTITVIFLNPPKASKERARLSIPPQTPVDPPKSWIRFQELVENWKKTNPKNKK